MKLNRYFKYYSALVLNMTASLNPSHQRPLANSTTFMHTTFALGGALGTTNSGVATSTSLHK